MVSSRTATAVAGLLGSLAVTVALWVYFDSLFVFLFLPFVPFLFRGRHSDGGSDRPPVRECPVCDFRTRNDDFEYCPRDGHRLE
jgi:hypothetical protein